MAYRGVLDDIRRCIDLEVPKRLPVMALTEEFDIDQAGFTYEEYSTDPEKTPLVHIRGIECFDYDWTNIYIDDCLEFEPLGVKTVGSGNIPKSVAEFLPATREQLARLRIPDPLRDWRMPILLKAIKRVKDRFGDNVMVCGRSPAPFSAATLLFGVEPVMLLMYDNPNLLSEMMRFLLEVEEVYAKAQIDSGADALWVGDCSASSRFLSLEHFKRSAMQPAAELLSRLKSLGATGIYFAAERDVEHLKATAGMGADIIGLSENSDLIECKEAVGDRVCLMGNLDPINVLLNGSTDLVTCEVDRIVTTVSKLGGHLFNTGEGVPAGTPMENVEAMISTIRNSWQ